MIVCMIISGAMLLAVGCWFMEAMFVLFGDDVPDWISRDAPLLTIGCLLGGAMLVLLGFLRMFT